MTTGTIFSGFDLPSRKPLQAGSFPHRTPATLSAWLDQQPAKELASKAAVLLLAQRTLNRLILALPEAIALIRVLDDRARPLLAHLDAQLRDLPPPLSREVLPLATLYVGLLQELATAHLRLMEDDREARSITTNDLGAHLHRALFLNGCQCLQAWRRFQPVSQGIWLQNYRILACAEHLGMAADSPTEPAHEHDQALGPGSIEQLIAQITVLSACDVYALNPGEIEFLARWLHAVPVACTASVVVDNPQPLLRLQLDEDHPPSMMMGDPALGATTRYVSLEPVLTALRERPPDEGLPGGPGVGSDRLDRRLRRRWVIPPVRQFIREAADTGPVIAATGLKAIHTLIRADFAYHRSVDTVSSKLVPGVSFAPGGADPRSTPAGWAPAPQTGAAAHGMGLGGAAPPSSAAIRELQPKALERLMAVWESAVRELEAPAPEAEPAPFSEDLRPIVAWLKNVGAGGVCLRLQAPRPKIMGGHLIAIRMVEQEQLYWQLGLIRWLRHDDPEGVTVGVQLLAPACTPIDLQPLSGPAAGGTAHPGFFCTQRDKPGATLLFAPGAFTAGTHVAIEVAGERHAVALTSIDPQSHTCSRAEVVLPNRSR